MPSRQSGQAHEKAQSGNGEPLSEVAMDLGSTPRRLGLAARRLGDGAAPTREAAAGVKLPRKQQTTRLVIDGPVAGGDDAASVGGVLVVPGRNYAPSPLDDRRQGHDVVRFEIGFDDEVDEAGRERAIGVAVAAVSGEANLVLDPKIGRAVGVLP